MLVGSGVTILYAASVFIPAIAADTGWDRSAVAGALAPAALSIAIGSAFFGALTDRVGPRLVLAVAGIAYALGLVAIPVLSTSAGMFALALTIAAVFSAATTPVTYSYLIIGWLPEHRGLALGVALACSGAGVAIVPALLGQLIPELGWRMSYVVLGASVAVLVVPSALFLVKDPPRARGTPAKGATARPAVGLSIAEAITNPAFWTLSFAFLLNGLVATAGTISMPSVAEDYGVAPVTASRTMIAVGVSMIFSRVVIGALFDRFPPIFLAAVVFAAPALGYAILCTDSGLTGFIGAAVLFGVAVGAEGDAMAVILSRRFGMRDFGKIFGLNFAAYAVCGGLGPWLLSTLRQWFASDALAFGALAGLAIVAVSLMATNRSRHLVHDR